MTGSIRVCANSAIVGAVIVLIASLAGCSEELAAEDQIFITNSATSPLERLGADHVQFVPVDAQLSLPEVMSSEAGIDHQVVVLQCAPTDDGMTVFGTVSLSNYENRLDSASIRESLAASIPGCTSRV
ncbi:hypothetical protein ACFWHR_11215 [Leucobacter sp. NPDC058333]|uniref:hypothetical protein n=1 Tax=Leucobacter sp. NPDC058333 TaxID=3346450 RepID=UPI003661CC0B